MSKDLFAREALAQIPKILTLLDRNPHSRTYGCFDRNFWHYKIKDFANGRMQELVLPLALVYDLPISDNPYYQQPAIKNWVEAGILYTTDTVHNDNFCDQNFPLEHSASATAFSLFACLESYHLLGLMNYEGLQSFERRANGLAYCKFSQSASQEALIILCLERLGQMLQTSKWHRIKASRLDWLFSLQSQEGWFKEYDTFDPGYHSLTISFLAQLDDLRGDLRFKESLLKAVELASYFIHPDGSYGGEYGSLNTYQFFPYGFELVGEWLPDALRINDRFLQGLKNGLSACYGDDYLLGNWVGNYLLAWRNFVPGRPQPLPRDVASIGLKEAEILIKRRPHVELYVALNKGGVFKLFRENKLILSDTHFSLQVRQGRQIKNAVAHLMSSYTIHVEQDDVLIEGGLSWVKPNQLSSLKLVLMRILILILGRFFSKQIQSLNPSEIVRGKQDAPFRFTRRFRWERNQWHIIDELYADSWRGIISAGISCDQTSMDIPSSRTFQRGQLQPWLDLTDEIRKLTPGQCLKLERRF
ncbi:hypothetical protein PCC9214_03638 [Planktothrix tepida]|uniref:Uncharacterized protein n=2 Tax=Planktothrix TaxID=54304 RepID=A0A1J1LSK3_9CYAN|nr:MULTISPECIES: hypothetical protein [Planktothrix]CAD5942631.1 hypothetical protein NO713_02022 [Planktothrix pseudagardhii]CAD5968273.1 hypothetical protein PCC9214_03638 [Planktothrix tepida]CUR35182.1 conserved hypothetical protein [Planktothrix tepida PCC 9214]